MAKMQTDTQQPRVGWDASPWRRIAAMHRIGNILAPL